MIGKKYDATPIGSSLEPDADAHISRSPAGHASRTQDYEGRGGSCDEKNACPAAVYQCSPTDDVQGSPPLLRPTGHVVEQRPRDDARA